MGRKSILVQSECAIHGMAEFYYYPHLVSTPYRCAVCIREKKRELDAKKRALGDTPEMLRQKRLQAEWMLKNTDRVKELKEASLQRNKEKLRNQKLNLLSKYDETIKSIYDVFNFEYDVESVLKVMSYKTNELNIVDTFLTYCTNKFGNKIKQRETWTASTLVKYHKGLVKTKTIKGKDTTISKYAKASERTKKKIRLETNEYVELIVKERLAPYLAKLEQLNIIVKDIKLKKEEKVLPVITLAERQAKLAAIKAEMEKDDNVFKFKQFSTPITPNKLLYSFNSLSREDIEIVKELFNQNNIEMTLLIDKKAELNESRRKKSGTGLLGVSNQTINGKGEYLVHIFANGKKEFLGSYPTIQEASDVHDRKAIKYYGFELAKRTKLLNNPDKFEPIQQVVIHQPIQKFKGVQTRMKGGKIYFISRLEYNGNAYYKSFDNAIDAALDYNKKVCEVYGTDVAKEKKMLNKIKKSTLLDLQGVI
jgi:hypothetical protein